MNEPKYNVRIILEDEDGLTWVEHLREVTQDEFEMYYGNVCYNIISIEMRMIK